MHAFSMVLRCHAAAAAVNIYQCSEFGIPADSTVLLVLYIINLLFHEHCKLILKTANSIPTRSGLLNPNLEIRPQFFNSDDNLRISL